MLVRVNYRTPPDECIQNNYNMKACLYNTVVLMKKGVVPMLVAEKSRIIAVTVTVSAIR